MKDTYIKAVLQMIDSGIKSEDILSGLKRTLEERGHDRLYVTILSGVLRVLEAGSANTATVSVARKDDYDNHKEAIAKTLSSLKVEGEPAIAIDETLIGGYVVESNSTRLDASYKKSLVDLYRTITK